MPKVQVTETVLRDAHQSLLATRVRTRDLLNIADAYEDADFDFSGARAFDEKSGYRSKSFLTVPLKNKAGEVTGVLQLVNCTDAESGDIVAATPDVIEIVEALASQAAVTLENQLLLQALYPLLEHRDEAVRKRASMTLGSLV